MALTKTNVGSAFPASAWQVERSNRARRNQFLESLIVSTVLTGLLILGISQAASSSFFAPTLKLMILMFLVLSLVLHIGLAAFGNLSFQNGFRLLGRWTFTFVFRGLFRLFLVLSFPILQVSVRLRVKSGRTGHKSLENWTMAPEIKFVSTWTDWSPSVELGKNSSLADGVEAFNRVRGSLGFWAAAIVAIALLIGALLIFVQTSAVAPFIYTLF